MHSAMHTENISRSGVLIAWRGQDQPVPAPRIGQIVTIEIELPANHSYGQKCIHCQGTVTRVSEAQTDCPRVALRVNYMDFRAFQDRLGALEAMQPADTWMA